ncbi:hypothetical protein [Nocardia sp. NBC_01388]|uniref:hypothetical protein n=1 Tax=Nocardia sp. NBC_01388 TaxID=2903596 RepID=UPI003249A13B
MLDKALRELTTLKRAYPADDIATRLVRHPVGLTDTEMVHQLVTCYSAGLPGPIFSPDYIQAWLNYADWDDTTFAAEDPIQ